MASEITVHKHEADDRDCFFDCINFLPNFLDCLEPTIRKKYLLILHGTQQKCLSAPATECLCLANELELVRPGNPSAHFILLEQLVSDLSSTEHDFAVELIQQQLNKLPYSQRYWMYLILGSLNGQVGNHKESADAHENALKSLDGQVIDGNQLKKALATINIFIDVYLQDKQDKQLDTGKMAQTQRETAELLEELEPELGNLTSVNCEKAILCLKIYKAAAYMCHRQGNDAESARYSKKVLQIINLDENAYLQAAETHALIANSMTWNKEREVIEDIRGHIEKAYRYASNVISSVFYVRNHSYQLCRNVLFKLSVNCDELRDKETCLEILLKAFYLLERYLDPNHPGIAVVASNVAQKSAMWKADTGFVWRYIEISEKVLENYGYREDDAIGNLYESEITTSFTNLGFAYYSLKMFEKAELAGKLALELNIKTRGESERTAASYRFLGTLYLQNHYSEKAIKNFRKCLEIRYTLLPLRTDLILKLQHLLRQAQLQRAGIPTKKRNV